MLCNIIYAPVEEIKAIGRFELREKWQMAILVAVILLTSVQIPVTVCKLLILSDVEIANLKVLTLIGYLSAISVIGAFAFGISFVFLESFRGNYVQISDVFLGFRIFDKTLGLMLLYSLSVIFWSLLLIVPGIIVAIKYCQAFFILADDPRKGIYQCMSESKAMMNGNIMKYLFVVLSFVGWVVLAIIPQAIIWTISAYSQSGEIMTEILTVTVGVVSFAPLMAYVYSTLTSFYEIASGEISLEAELEFEI